MVTLEKEVGDGDDGGDFKVPLAIVNLVYVFAKGSALPHLSVSALRDNLINF